MAGPRIAIVGCGAIGLYYGARLARGGNDVRFLLRSDFDAVRARGIRVRSVRGDFALDSVNAFDNAAAIGPCDVVLVALKTVHNRALPELLAPMLAADTLVVTLQNGLGNEEFLAAAIGADRVAGGLCFVCITRTAPGEVEHSASGLVSLGAFNRPAGPRLHALAERMRASEIDCRVIDDLDRERWRKLVWNVPFNGLAIAAGGIDVARILADPEMELLARQLMGEILVGAAALGHDLPASLIDKQIEITRPMRDYKPSSLIDFLAGRPVEVEAIWGEPFRRATAAGAEMPRLGMLYRLLRALTAGAKSAMPGG